MLEWQERYIRNARRIRILNDFARDHARGYEAWRESRRLAEGEEAELREENIRLLKTEFFPMLDTLYSASPEALSSLEEFGDALMDWKTNLDSGLYVVIHDAFLTLCRHRQDREGVIRELYRLGMGLYYRGRMMIGIDHPRVNTLRFQNELAFREAGSYFRFFEQMESEETKGYIVRSMANVAICTTDHLRKIAATSRALAVIRDEKIRQAAPGLPWERFERAAVQQMSANRSDMNSQGLSREDLAEVLDACYEVFRQEEGVEKPSIRWRWPYYEMEYNLGYASAEVTADRLEALIRSVPEEACDESGRYGNIQLPVFYGRLLRNRPKLAREQARIRFLDFAYRKMLRTMMALPAEHFDDYLIYLLADIISDFYETEGVISYKETVLQLMRRFTGEIYIRGCRVGRIMRILSMAMLRADPDAFDALPMIREEAWRDSPEESLGAYAEECGLFHAFGQIKMSMHRLARTRELLEGEYQIFTLYPVSGRNDLAERASTRDYADVAFGHRRWYNGLEGYPEEYVRNESPFRQMTDVAAVAVYLAEQREKPFPETLKEIFALEGQRFSPLVTKALAGAETAEAVKACLEDEGGEWYRAAWESFRRERT